MVDRVAARACANIALTKYWGKSGPGNAPATPSVSLALAALATETTIDRSSRDRFRLDGRLADAATRARLGAYLDLWRERGLLTGRFAIESRNDFPTAAGLASSASGYAALAVGLAALAERRVSPSETTRLARRGSGSAARSVPGGLAYLPTGKDPSARVLVAAEEVPWSMVVAVVEAGPKEIPSRRGMRESAATSPLYRAWLSGARRDTRAMLAAVEEMDVQRVGEIAEENMMAMHACMIATRPALLYWAPGTLRLLEAVRVWRKAGLASWATIDAGPHVAFLCRTEDARRVERRARRVEGVIQVIRSGPGGPARAEVIR
jgi:diphosphomevalonate decarboxylase